MQINIFYVLLPLWFVLTCLCAMAFVVYSLCVFYRMIKEASIACEGDGEKTTGLGFFFLLNCATLGVYSFIWWYKFGKRLAKNAPRYGMEFKKLGRTMLALTISRVLYVPLCFAPYIIYDLAFSSEDPGLSEVFFFAFLLYRTMAACIVGVAVFHFVLMGIAFKYTNRTCAGYNAAHGL